MKAMVLAAGLGTRLRPLTDERPKALVEINGRTLLEIALARLREFGVREVIVNVHHFADMVVEYLAAKQNFGMRIEVSREDVLLDTGGGLKKAAWFFLEDGSEESFLLHNVDVVSDIDLGRMLDFHRSQQALATLAVQERPSSRQLRQQRRSARAWGTSCGGASAAPSYFISARMVEYRGERNIESTGGPNGQSDSNPHGRLWPRHDRLQPCLEADR